MKSPHGEISMLHVEPEHRRKGLATAIMLQFCKMLYSQGMVTYCRVESKNIESLNSGASRISRWGGGGADLRRGCFSAKTKELDPVGGGAGGTPLDPPMLNLHKKLEFVIEEGADTRWINYKPKPKDGVK